MKDLSKIWKGEEKLSFSGWDFSYIDNRMKEEKPIWNYKRKAKKLVRKATAVLDMGTGGEEVLSLLGPFPKHTIATEGWKPNVKVARNRLQPFGVKVVAVDDSGKLPFDSREFDLVLNRHSAYEAKEVFRILRSNGIFFTQQVSGNNLQNLTDEFDVKKQFRDRNAKTEKKLLESVGFKVEDYRDWKGKIEFKDVGAIVYFLKVVPWTVKDFSVDKYLSVLKKLQRKLDLGKKLVFTETRFLIKARKLI